MDTPQTPIGLPRAVHPDLSPASAPAAVTEGPEDGRPPPAARVAPVRSAATGPFKVYSPDATDWSVGIDLCVGPDGLAITTPTGSHDFAAERFTVEMSPDGMFVWILGDRLDRPAVTVLMPASLEDLRSRLPGVEFADLDEAAHTVHRLTAAAAAGRHTRHRFGLHRTGDMGLVINPLDGEPVLALLRIAEGGMEFRTGGVWEAYSPAKRIPSFTSLIPVTRGAVARFDHLERSPSMSLSLFRRFVIPGELPAAAPSAQTPDRSRPDRQRPDHATPQPPAGSSSPASARSA